jgi:uncharacterized protein (TIGR03382 family)
MVYPLQFTRAMRNVLLTLTVLPALAHAFTIESVATTGCHEKVTAKALSRSRWPEGAAPAAASNALVDGVAFTVPAGADEWTVSLLIGARDNDLHGASASDFAELSALHNAADGQEEHCLRAPGDDGAEGDRRAVEACRAYILSELKLALGEGETVDFAATEDLAVGLRYDHATLALPRFPVHMGKALHALQDSFTHTYRANALKQIATVFNYAEPATSSDYASQRDGLEHRGDFDACEAESGPEAERVEAAVTASAQLLDAVGAEGSKAERLARAEKALEQWVSVAEGCTEENAWCGAEQPKPEGCSATGGAPALALLALIVSMLRKR